ncbi:membrane protein [Bacillus sp. UNC41MFS5]|uniref:membrane protein n=1 Tax=Bacillus sp. UNC41MFS5 TaxID=1449046 RepID=UPI000478AD29|nr:membrane protein [Bacillus sp. UNC41MFS5]
MYVIASFEHSLHLELSINELEQKGIKKENIFVVPLVPKIGQSKIFDTIHRSDGTSLMDAPAILGTLLAVLGATYGYILNWGPIIWGLIGLGTGFVLGFIFELLINRKKLYRKRRKESATEVFVLVMCYGTQSEMVAEVLYEYFAFGVAKVNQG